MLCDELCGKPEQSYLEGRAQTQTATAQRCAHPVACVEVKHMNMTMWVVGHAELCSAMSAMCAISVFERGNFGTCAVTIEGRRTLRGAEAEPERLVTRLKGVGDVGTGPN